MEKLRNYLFFSYITREKKLNVFFDISMYCKNFVDSRVITNTHTHHTHTHTHTLTHTYIYIYIYAHIHMYRQKTQCVFYI